MADEVLDGADVVLQLLGERQIDVEPRDIEWKLPIDDGQITLKLDDGSESVTNGDTSIQTVPGGIKDT